MRLKTSSLFAQCYSNYAIPAVNVFFMEEVLALFAAASRAKSPVIVQITPFAREYASPIMLRAMIDAAAQMYPDVVYAVHLDHGYEAHIDAALQEGGYSAVMIDASHDAFEENVRRTKQVVTKAHALDIDVEAELGVLAGVEDDVVVAKEKALYTNPEEVLAFVQATGCDSLAIAVGTSHGAYKFSGSQGLQFTILAEIQRLLPRYPLVLHGGSNVNPQVIQRINAAGGRLKQDAKGVQDDEIKRAISLGICKINIATDMRLLWTMVNREFFKNNPDEFAPTTPGKVYMQQYQEFIISKMELFGSTGKASAFL